MSAKQTASPPSPHRPRKRFGQNFLHDRHYIERIVEAIAPSPDNHILEIGPGQGALTRPIAASGCQLDCVELDRDLATVLHSEFAGHSRIRVHQGDILKLNLESLQNSGAALRVVGNLPYNISTPVMFHLLQRAALISDMVFMLQLEVVQRMTAVTGDKNYGRLSLMLQYCCAVEALFEVPPTAFTPRPKVTSAIVRLTPHSILPYPAVDYSDFETVVRTAFNQRRKTLRNSLRSLFPEQVPESITVDLGLRPENLGLADFVELSNAYSATKD